MHVLKLVMQLFLLCNSSGHEGLGRGVWVLQCIEPPTRDDLGPELRAVTHSFILAFPRWISIRYYIPPPPLVLSALFPGSILFQFMWRLYWAQKICGAIICC